jgi:hypothetical protein
LAIITILNIRSFILLSLIAGYIYSVMILEFGGQVNWPVLSFQLPTDTTAASTTLRLWVFQNAEAAPYKFRCKINGRTVEKGHGDGIDKNVGRFESRMGKVA